jgi:rRNA processing protein Krr1/Pno1
MQIKIMKWAKSHEPEKAETNCQHVSILSLSFSFDAGEAFFILSLELELITIAITDHVQTYSLALESWRRQPVPVVWPGVYLMVLGLKVLIHSF